MSKFKKIILIIFFCLIFLEFAVNIINIGFDAQKKLISDLTERANVLNSKAPFKLSDDLGFEQAFVGPDNRFNVILKVLKLNSRDLNKSAEESTKIKSMIKTMTIKDTCSQDFYKPYLEFGIIFSSTYKSKDGIEIGKAEVNRHDCGF